MEFKARKIHVHLQQNRSSCGAENKSTTNVKKKNNKKKSKAHTLWDSNFPSFVHLMNSRYAQNDTVSMVRQKRQNWLLAECKRIFLNYFFVYMELKCTPQHNLKSPRPQQHSCTSLVYSCINAVGILGFCICQNLIQCYIFSLSFVSEFLVLLSP